MCGSHHRGPSPDSSIATTAPKPGEAMVFQLYDCVLQCQKPGCPSWIFLRKLGYHTKCSMCGTSWSKSYPMGCTTHQELMATKAMKEKPMKAMKAMKGQDNKNAKMTMKTKEDQKNKNAKTTKAMKAMMSTKTMKGSKAMKAIKPKKDQAMKSMKAK